MKRLVLILIPIITFFACKKKAVENPDWFQIEIANPANIDCSFPEIVFLTRKQEAYQIIGDSRGKYVALGLPKVFYPAGTKMNVHIHRPSVNEIAVCTTLGPAWSQVIIDEIK